MSAAVSDTPKTDAFELLVNRPMNWWDWARQLERENADLHDTIDAVIAADERAVDLWRAAHPGKELVIPDRTKLVGWLLEQNAALRKDKERLDWILTDDGGFWVNWMYDIDEWKPELKASRDAIDACVKPSTWKAGNP